MTSKVQFIVEINGVAQAETNSLVRQDCVMLIQRLPEHLVMKASVVEYVRKN